MVVRYLRRTVAGGKIDKRLSKRLAPQRSRGRTYNGRGKLSSLLWLSCVQYFVTPWTAAGQASLSITNSQSSLKLMFIESVVPSNHLILCHPLLLPPSIFPSIKSFPRRLFSATGGQSIRVSSSASVLPMNILE